jgi:hypothetical protein
VLYSVIGDDFLDSLPSDAFDFGYAANVFVRLDAYGIFHYLRGDARVLRPGGRFWFNACTVGVNTIDLFRTLQQRIELPRRAGTPATCGGMTFA